MRAGEVVSKADILEHVWDFAYEGDPNIVEVYVSALRRKLGAGPHRDRARRRVPAGGGAVRRRCGSVRARATLGATLVVAVALVAAGAAVLLCCASNLSDQADAQAEVAARAWPRSSRRDAVRPARLPDGDDPRCRSSTRHGRVRGGQRGSGGRSTGTRASVRPAPSRRGAGGRRGGGRRRRLGRRRVDDETRLRRRAPRPSTATRPTTGSPPCEARTRRRRARSPCTRAPAAVDAAPSAPR